MPNGEQRIIYSLSEGKTATLAIYSDVERRRVTGAKVSLLCIMRRIPAAETGIFLLLQLQDSSISIDDIVARWRPSNDLQELVLEVLARIT
jgi:hypothetical protein